MKKGKAAITRSVGMKMKLLGLILGALMVVQGGSAATAFLEDFEDDTPGGNPSAAGDYTALGTWDVQASGGNPDQYAKAAGDHTSRDRMEFDSFDLCVAGADLQFDVYATAPVGTTNGFIGWLSPSDLGSTGSGLFSGMGIFLESAAGNPIRLGLEDGISAFSGAGTALSSWVYDEWQTVRYYDADCDVSGGTSISMDLTRQSSGVTNSYTYNSGEDPGSTQMFFNFGEYNNGAGTWPTIRVDNVLTNGQDLLGVDPPAGLSGEVVRVGSTTTTGRVDLTWLLSSDDPDTDTGEFDYLVYVDGMPVAEDSIDSSDGGGTRSYTYFFTGNDSFGNQTFHVTAEAVLESEPSCTITLDLDTLGDKDSCGEAVIIQPEPEELETGILTLVEDRGFRSEASQQFLVILLVSIATVAASAAFSMIASGRMKNMLILAMPVVVAFLCILFDWLDVWMFIVSLVLAVGVVNAGSSVRNTWFDIQDRLARIRIGVEEAAMEASTRFQAFVASRRGVESFDESEPDGEDQ